MDAGGEDAYLVVLEIAQRTGSERFGRTRAGLVSQARSGVQEEGGQGQGGRGDVVCLEVGQGAGGVQLSVRHPPLLSRPLSRTSHSALYCVLTWRRPTIYPEISI